MSKQADEAFAETISAIQRKLARLTEAAGSRFDAAPGYITWANVGSATEVLMRLSDLEQFVFGGKSQQGAQS